MLNVEIFKVKDFVELIIVMKKYYFELKDEFSLELSVKVFKNEMKWL